MTVKIIGLIIGILVLFAGIYYLAKERSRIEKDLHHRQRARRHHRRRLRRAALPFLTGGYHR